MGIKDQSTKLLEDYNDVFSDIFNVLLFKDEVVKETKLVNGPTESIYKMDTEETHEQRRDVLKRYQDAEYHISSFGIENQAKYDKTMPFRVMSYDSSTYMEQVKSQEKDILPIATIVLNFSYEKWGNAKSLYTAMNVPEELRTCVSDYKIKVFDIAYLNDETIGKFKSDFGTVARFLRAKRLGEDNPFQGNEAEVKHIQELLGLLTVLTNDPVYSKKIAPGLIERAAKGEVIKMCEIADGLIAKGKAEAVIENAKFFHNKGMGDADIIEMICQSLKVSNEEAEEIFEKEILGLVTT